MAFLRYANAIVEDESVGVKGWNQVRQASGGDSPFNKVSSVSLGDYSPDKYLLTHCTIIASVDVDSVPNVKIGEGIIASDGDSIKRPYDDYHITPETSKFVNANGDAWERELLLGTFRTFIGAENYVEHIQIPELSKGKVIDAVARDLDDTVYIDILVATNRKHAELVKDIESGKINTLSMGCSIQYSICTKCGNVAADDTELCSHVRYEKGNNFHDAKGNKRVVAELCGHRTDLESVTFIEASWVANPAFKGAVLRNVLNNSSNITEEERSATAESQLNMLSASPMLAEFMENQNIDKHVRTATAQVLSEELETFRLLQKEMRQVLSSVKPMTKKAWGDEEEEDDGGDEEEESSTIEEVRKKIKDQLGDDIKQELVRELEEELGLGPEEKVFDGDNTKPNNNDNLIKAFQSFNSRYASELRNNERLRRVFSVVYEARANGWNSVTKLGGIENEDIIAAMYIKDRDFRKNPLSSEIYSCLSKVGGSSNYNNAGAFINACRLALGRKTTAEEEKALIRRSRFLK